LRVTIKKLKKKLLVESIKLTLREFLMVHNKWNYLLARKRNIPAKLPLYQHYCAISKYRNSKKKIAAFFTKQIKIKKFQKASKHSPKKQIKIVYPISKSAVYLQKTRIKIKKFANIFSKNIWRKYFFKWNYAKNDGLVKIANHDCRINRRSPNRTYKHTHNRLTRKLIKIYARKLLDIPYYLKKKRKKKRITRPKIWGNLFQKKDYFNLSQDNRKMGKLYFPLSSVWVLTKKFRPYVARNGYVTTYFFPKLIGTITSTWHPRLRQLFKLLLLSKNNNNTKKKFLAEKMALDSICGGKINISCWSREKIYGGKKIIFKHKLFLPNNKLNKIPWKRLRRIHRFGNFKW
jgi:hypothetical protein